MRILTVFLLFVALNADAWVQEFAPEFKSTPAKFRELSYQNRSNYVDAVSESWEEDRDSSFVDWSQALALDLNGDNVEDYILIVPSMGCGLYARWNDAYFCISNGKGGRTEFTIGGYDIEKNDFINISGKIYFRLSDMFSSFEKSQHNHWVYQVFRFDKNGNATCANAEVGKSFPAVTIYYYKPKFKQIELTGADLKKIGDDNKAKVKKCKKVPKSLLEQFKR